MSLHHFLSFLFFFSITKTTIAIAASIETDTAALTLFRTQTDLHGTLLSNWTTTTTTISNPCISNWIGINCTNNRITAVHLPSLNLRGSITPLSSLDQLRFLDLKNNRLNGTLTPLSQCKNLKLVYLSGNDFSGEIPNEFSYLNRLRRLDLSNNNLRGVIPNELVNLTRLLTFRVENNEISGRLPEFIGSLPELKQLNVSNNEFYGNLDKELVLKFGRTSFLGNEGLCGTTLPFPKCSFTGRPDETVPSNPSSFPTSNSGNIEVPREKSGRRLGKGAFVAIVVISAVVLLVIVSFSLAFYCGKYTRETNSMGSESGKRRSSSYSGEKRVYASTGGGESDGTNVTDKSKLVFFERKKQFELEDLLRASAEMVGKGTLGTVYKAVLDDGSTVAVKRLKDANPCPRKEFEQYMDVIGKLKHPNVVRFRAYYYAREEKLLVYDYLPNGSLHSLLHGNRGPGRIPLDWTTRISLMLGAARGLARIHQEYATSRIPHGNMKSSNVLLDKNGNACISDFGMSLLLSPAHAIAKLGGYKAPEQSETKRLSQMADVYSFGVLLLEVLTGRAPSVNSSSGKAKIENDESGVDLPKWVQSVVRDEWTAEVFDQELLRYKNIEEELVSMLHVGMACVVALPQNRPTMNEVVKMIEEIRVEQSPLGEDYDESRASLSPSLATTEDALA